MPNEVTASPSARLVDWLCVKAELGRARDAASKLSPRSREYLRRANIAFEMADLALSPGKSVDSAPGLPLASNSFRESIHWALRARGLGNDQTSAPAIWAAADPEWLARIAAQIGEVTEIGRAMDSTFVEFAADSAERQRSTSEQLRRFAQRLLVEVEGPLRALELAKQKRSNRMLLVLAICVVPIVFIALRLLSPVNLAHDKPWRTSSTYATCHPKELECAGVTTDILFHTNVEKEPWFEYDFGAPLAFSALTVKNRLDYGLELSSPLVAEVSNDGKTYREVAHRSDWFSTWRPNFAAQRARYLRLRVLRTSAFHLKSVAVHP